jgi:integrase/recombinase XerD
MINVHHGNKRKQQNQQQQTQLDILQGKVDVATKDVRGGPWFKRTLLDETKINANNANAICDYILTMQQESNISTSTRRNILITLVSFSKRAGLIDFEKIDRQNVKTYLSTFQKSEEEDQSHKWIGTHTVVTATIQKFYRWLYYPNVKPDERPLPDQVSGLSRIRRKEQTSYKVNDLWTMEEHAIFLKYCPSSRIKAYHAMALDTSARPHELLKLKIKDLKERIIPPIKDPITQAIKRHECIIFQFTVSGKTGSRTLALTTSMPYVKEWLLQHQMGGNKDALLFGGYRKSRSQGLTPNNLHKLYTITYKQDYFPALLKSDNVPDADKQIIQRMLEERKWNPYIIRHYSLTMKSKERLISDAMLRQHAGWSKQSNMPTVYLHHYSNSSTDELLRAQGYLPPKDDTGFEQNFNHLVGIKKCGNCGTTNLPEAISCAHCHLLIDSVALNEIMKEQQEKDAKIAAIESKIEALMISVENEKKWVLEEQNRIKKRN